MNKISQINKNSHMIYEVPKIVWNFNGEILKKISQKYNQSFPVAYKGTYQKRFSGIRPLRGGGTPLFR